MIHPDSNAYSCFLITAYGEKPLLRDISKATNFQTANFDTIYYEIKFAVEEYTRRYPNTSLVLKDSRDYSGGVITKEFFQQLYKADLVIAEISSVSPNVYYELGVRMALRKSATILLALEGTELPFDLKNIRVIFYQAGKLRDKWNELHRFMEARLNGETDSPVYDALPDLEIIQRSEIDAIKRKNLELQQQIELIRSEDKAFFLIEQAKKLLLNDPNACKQAVQMHRQAYDLSPSNFRVVFAYGKILHQVAKYDDAIAVLEQAIKLNEQGSQPLSEPYRELGLAYRRRGTKLGSEEDYRQAKAYMLEATRLNREDDDAWGILGGLHKRLYEVREAVKCYRTGLEVNPQSTYCLVNEMMLLILCLKLGVHETSIDDRMRLKALSKQGESLLGSVTLESTNYWRVVNRAEVLLLLEKTEDALKFYKRAAEIVDTPDKLKSALDNLTYIQDHGDLPGTDKAMDILWRKREQIIPT
jgi:tetratricopeptide (TPR) repeat protein